MKLRPAIKPELKEFIDECVVPLLVREYLAQMAADKSLASSAASAVHSGATAAPASASEGEA
jgi:hypothetical protein